MQNSVVQQNEENQNQNRIVVPEQLHGNGINGGRSNSTDSESSNIANDHGANNHGGNNHGVDNNFQNPPQLSPEQQEI